MGWVLTGRDEDGADDVEAGISGTEMLGWDDEGREDKGGSGTQELDTVEWRISKGKESVGAGKWEVEEDGEAELGEGELTKTNQILR